MPEETRHSLTQLLQDASNGDEGATNALVPLVYDELRRLARSYMRRERPGHTLQTTALVHEAYLRLVGQDLNFANRSQFFGIAAQMMRRILVDQARGRGRAKRGGGAIRITLDEPELMVAQSDDELLALDEALRKFEKVDPQRARIVELRFFGGLSNEETSAALAISTATVQRQWAGARAWLFHELKCKG